MKNKEIKLSIDTEVISEAIANEISEGLSDASWYSDIIFDAVEVVIKDVMKDDDIRAKIKEKLIANL